METKNPFFQEGISALVKVGERSLLETAVRWADAVNNKEGLPVFAYKINFSYLQADDWVADNYDPIDGSRVTADNPGGFDAVNIYGDEYQSRNDFSDQSTGFPGSGTWYRTGYQEIDLVDYDTRNLKLGGALHFRTSPNKMEESPELIVSTNYGTGTTVYQGDNRFSLRGITFLQNRIEWAKRDKFFIRAYTTRIAGAGDSYDPYFTALELQRRAKSDINWARDYSGYWQEPIVNGTV